MYCIIISMYCIIISRLGFFNYKDGIELNWDVTFNLNKTKINFT